jgi:hypothetical protein
MMTATISQTFRRLTLTAATAAMAVAVSVPAHAAVDSALAALIPADASTVSGVNVAQAKASSFGRFVLSQMNLDDNSVQNFVLETGFDPRRDLNDLMLATTGVGEKTQAVVLGRGTFNPGKILNTARTHGATVTNYKGVDIASHKEGAIAFIDASLAIAGHDTAVRAVIDQRGSGKSLPEAITKKMQELSAQNDAWFYSATSPADFFAGKMDPNIGGAMKDGLMQAVLQAAGGIKFNEKEARISGEAVTRSDKDATALADVFRFLAQIVQQNSGNANNQQGAADLAALISKMQLSTESNVMKVSLAIPEEMLERVFRSPRARARTAVRAAVR